METVLIYIVIGTSVSLKLGIFLSYIWFKFFDTDENYYVPDKLITLTCWLGIHKCQTYEKDDSKHYQCKNCDYEKFERY